MIGLDGERVGMAKLYLSARFPLMCAALLAVSGCASAPHGESWGGGARWPDSAGLKHAFASAASDPMTWVPLVGAGLLVVSDTDESLTEWAFENKPLFGDDAEDVSDNLRDASMAIYLVTALVAPSDSVSDRARGLGVGVSSHVLAGSLSKGIKVLVDRDRPNGGSDKSFPSGHATLATTDATLTASTLAYFDMPQWAETGLKAGVFGIAGLTAWARVEAGKHYFSDVLAGYSLGHFVAAFMQEAFLGPEPGPYHIGFTPVDKGGVFTLRMELGK